MNPLDYILDRVGSTTAYDVIKARLESIAISKGIQETVAIVAGAKILTYFALFHSESLGAWQNPDYISGYTWNTDGYWYTTPPNPFTGDYAWEGRASDSLQQELDHLRNLRMQTNAIEGLTPEVDSLQLDGMISFIIHFLPSFLDASGNWIGYHLPSLQKMEDAISTLFNTATVARRKDPLVFDLNANGIETVGISTTAPILFDMSATGVKTSTGWVAPNDAFLVRDINGNGLIDNGRELFGDATLKANGQLATDGFDALADLDSNADGKISNADAQFANLRLWRDLNQDGISQTGELFTLTSQNIDSINVASASHLSPLTNGNQLADLGSFTKTDASTGSVGEVTGNLADINLAQDTFHSQFVDHITLTTQAQTLPDMQGAGQVRELREAASLSPTLAGSLVANDGEWRVANDGEWRVAA